MDLYIHEFLDFLLLHAMVIKGDMVTGLPQGVSCERYCKLSKIFFYQLSPVYPCSEVLPSQLDIAFAECLLLLVEYSGMRSLTC